MHDLNPQVAQAGSLSDTEIIQRVLGGEKELYALIIRKYNQRLYRVCMSILNNDSEAEDVMQVAYIKAYENLQGFQFRSGFSTWLTRILINECLLRLKKRKQLLHMNDEILSSQITTETRTPASAVINSELGVILESAIRNLPEKYRTVFIMREIENMNVAETTECLSISEVNVKVRLNRAKAMLRNSLSDYYKKEDILNFHLTRCNRVVNGVLQAIN